MIRGGDLGEKERVKIKSLQYWEKRKVINCTYEVFLAKENGNETLFNLCGAMETVVFCTTISVLCTIGISNVSDKSFPSPCLSEECSVIDVYRVYANIWPMLGQPLWINKGLLIV